ncbi:hypothetical protein JHK82_055134 [Glycine max]|nr:hypothetical protein JHK86_054975 [Glycine max]KAG4917667.1 hypothetical protein JHK85_055948 [Glycine max]KAG5073765.1 hypothetical protein JHK84_054996 [Glycine max]KAG5076439.1 hypothetical protein JHK82_055134 [Glycine max]
MQNKPIVAIRPTTSGSSGEQPDDEEVEGEINKTKNMTPVDAKRVRRMLSNRESDRCSRRRKQTHLTELGTQDSVKTASTEISSEVIIETFHNDDEALAASNDKVVLESSHDGTHS